MQETTCRTEEDRAAMRKLFADASIKTEDFGKNRLRSFHKGSTSVLRQKLQEAYDVAMKSGLAEMVKQQRIGRNDPCPCGSDKKFKKCCMWKCQ